MGSMSAHNGPIRFLCAKMCSVYSESRWLLICLGTGAKECISSMFHTASTFSVAAILHRPTPVLPVSINPSAGNFELCFLCDFCFDTTVFASHCPSSSSICVHLCLFEIFCASKPHGLTSICVYCLRCSWCSLDLWRESGCRVCSF